MEARLSGRVALVTGAATGVGRATALRLASEGADVAVTDLQEDRLAVVVGELEAVGARVVSVVGDIVEPDVSLELAARAEEMLGRIDVLVNNVGILILKSLLETTRSDFDALMDVNCWSHLAAMQAVVPAMRRTGSGSIINIASVGAYVALPNVSAYNASKSAVLGMTRAAAVEFAPDIRVNAVSPGGITTDMSRVHLESFEDKEAASKLLTGRQLIKRYGRPEEIASVVAFLASDDASFITGADIKAEAGHSAW
jgi:NAD(P)-dependent dehydrogenase (short-subunit alcohol dehydrogenase family)